MVMPGETSVCESCVKYLMVNIPFCWLLPFMYSKSQAKGY